MSDWLLPPFVEPSGPAGDDESVVRAWLREEPAPHSERLHVEGKVLRVDRDLPLALLLPMRSVLVRTDGPEETAPMREAVEQALTADGLVMLDQDNQLALAVGIQMVGARLATWDLWGLDVDMAFAALREAAVGDQGFPPHAAPDPP
jgi:hypothetical protein